MGIIDRYTLWLTTCLVYQATQAEIDRQIVELGAPEFIGD